MVWCAPEDPKHHPRVRDEHDANETNTTLLLTTTRRIRGAASSRFEIGRAMASAVGVDDGQWRRPGVNGVVRLA